MPKPRYFIPILDPIHLWRHRAERLTKTHERAARVYRVHRMRRARVRVRADAHAPRAGAAQHSAHHTSRPPRRSALLSLYPTQARSATTVAGWTRAIVS